MTSCRLLVCAALLLSASSARADAWRVDDGPVFVHHSPVDSRANLELGLRSIASDVGGEHVGLSIAKLVPIAGFGGGVYFDSGLEIGTRYGTYVPGVGVGVLGRGTLREHLDLVLRAGIDAPFDPRPRRPIDPDAPPPMYDPFPQTLELSATLVGERVGPGYRVGLAADLPLARWDDATRPEVRVELGGGGRKGDVAFAFELGIGRAFGGLSAFSGSVGASVQYHTRHVIPYVFGWIPARSGQYAGFGLGVQLPL